MFLKLKIISAPQFLVGKMYLNEKTPESFEDFLSDIQGTLKMDDPPITALFTLSPRHRKVSAVDDFSLQTKHGKAVHLSSTPTFLYILFIQD